MTACWPVGWANRNSGTLREGGVAKRKEIYDKVKNKIYLVLRWVGLYTQMNGTKGNELIERRVQMRMHRWQKMRE